MSSTTDLAPYPVLLDGAAHTITLPAYYQARGLVVVNNGSVDLTVTSARGERWTVGPGARLEAPQPTPAPSYTFQSERADPAGAVASATFTQALLPVLVNSSVATTTQALSDLLLLPQTNVAAWNGPPFTPPTFAISRPPDVDAISVISNGLLAGMSIQGSVTGITYATWGANSTQPAPVTSSGSIQRLSANISSLDTAIGIPAWSLAGGGGTIWVVGHRYAIPGSFATSGAQLVAVDTAANPVRVTLAGTQPTVPVSSPSPLAVSGVVRAAPAYSVVNAVASPLAGATIATVTVAAAGTYRLLALLAADDTPGALGKRIDLTIGGVAYGGLICPDSITIDLPALALAANTTVAAVAGVAGGGGSTYRAALFAYAL